MPFCHLDLSGLPRDVAPDEVADRFYQRNFYRATLNLIVDTSLLWAEGEDG